MLIHVISHVSADTCRAKHKEKVDAVSTSVDISVRMKNISFLIRTAAQPDWLARYAEGKTSASGLESCLPLLNGLAQMQWQSQILRHGTGKVAAYCCGC